MKLKPMNPLTLRASNFMDAALQHYVDGEAG